MDAERLILTRGLPKTDQTIQYAAYDDGDYEAGWWPGRKSINNRTRLIYKIIAGDKIVVDRATGLIWAADGTAEGCNNGAFIAWLAALAAANILDFAGFTDWRLPNMKELLSLINYRTSAPCISQGPFSNTVLDHYWSSTTDVTNTDDALCVDFDVQGIRGFPKTYDKYVRYVRGGL